MSLLYTCLIMILKEWICMHIFLDLSKLSARKIQNVFKTLFQSLSFLSKFSVKLKKNCDTNSTLYFISLDWHFNRCAMIDYILFDLLLSFIYIAKSLHFYCLIYYILLQNVTQPSQVLDSTHLSARSYNGEQLENNF